MSTSKITTLAQPKNIDVFILSLFAILITFNPFFTNGRINIFEVGLYLPGIQAVLDGLVPFRDVFHLRGGFELYMPAFLMSVFGEHIGVLFSYFYVGNVVCLIIAVLIARELFKTRLFLYLMIPVFIARTYPRVVFHYWGGVRYAFGLLVLYFIIRFFKTEKKVWIFLGGVASALGLFTSVEIGVCSVAGVLAALFFSVVCKIQTKEDVFKALLTFFAGMGLISIPYLVYLIATQSFWPMIDSFWSVVFNKENILDTHLVSVFPRNPVELAQVVFNPADKNFRHITPVYAYLGFLIYLIFRIRQVQLSKLDLAAVAIAGYGLIMYNAAFRNIWAAQFEMTLQIEKFMYFYMVEWVYLTLRNKKDIMGKLKPYLVGFVLFALIGSSWGYAIQRFNHRFYSFKFARNYLLGKDTLSLRPWSYEVSKPLSIERAKGIIVPAQQADEINEVVEFIQKNTAPNEAVFMYPELGTYSFFVDRPFVGRFPIPTFTWFKEQWHQEFMSELEKARPKFIVMPQAHPHNWEAVYLFPKKNREKFNAVMDFIRTNYVLAHSTATSNIYQLSDTPHPKLDEPLIQPYKPDAEEDNE